MKATLLIVPVLVGLVGCGSTGWKSEYSCPGMPNGVICKSPVEVYRLTQNTDRVVIDESAGEKDKMTSKVSGKSVSIVPTQLTTGRSLPREALPVLEPARVMRVWISPWIDAKQDLHMPGYVFTEVTPHRWSFGEAAAVGGRPLVPLQNDLRGSEIGDPDIGEQARMIAPRSLIQGMQQSSASGIGGAAAGVILPAAIGAIQTAQGGR